MSDWIPQADRYVRIVAEVCGAAEASVWLVRDDMLEHATGTTTLPISRGVSDAWIHWKGELRKPCTVHDRGLTLVPLISGLELTGLLVLRGDLPEDPIDRDYVERQIHRLGRLLAGDLPAPRLPLAVVVPLAEVVGGRRRVRSAAALRTVLEATGQNISKAAEFYGVSRDCFYDWLRAAGIDYKARKKKS